MLWIQVLEKEGKIEVTNFWLSGKRSRSREDERRTPDPEGQNQGSQ